MFSRPEAAVQSAPTASPLDRSNREAHSSHHRTPCAALIIKVIRPRVKDRLKSLQPKNRVVTLYAQLAHLREELRNARKRGPDPRVATCGPRCRSPASGYPERCQPHLFLIGLLQGKGGIQTVYDFAEKTDPSLRFNGKNLTRK